jgi:MurE/MurF fusion protein
MKIGDLVRELSGARLVGDGAVEVRQVRDDSRQVEPGDLFVAVRGLRTDGHAHADTAVERGAAALVVERELEVAIPQIVVADTSRALGPLVAASLGKPAERLVLCGITGTNGKTTTTYLMEAILAAAGRSPGVMGTVSYRFAGRSKPAPYTTPTAPVLHRVFAEMADAGCTDGVLEVSSAALSMDRLAGVQFRVGAFTNLTQDHLEVHETMEAYQAAKERLFRDHLAPDGIAVVNLDDPTAPAMIAAAGDRRILGVTSGAEVPGRVEPVRVLEETSTVAGIRAIIETPRGRLEVESKALVGGYNVSNIAVAVAIAEALEVPHQAIARGIAAMSGVPGRVERVPNDHGLDLLVDYAHTPDALRNVLAALRPLCTRRLICVFGCGGDRDPSKRPKMGAAVAELADLAVVTSDNPRTEEPQAILDMILPAVPDPFYVDVDRRTAIRAAVAEAVPGDIVLIAGKGHEDYQILGTRKIHFDDREEAQKAAAGRAPVPMSAVVSATRGRVERRGSHQAFDRVIIDGRQAAPGDLYVAIRGEAHDGHDFCAQAIAAGATGVMVAEDAEVPASGDVAVIRVEDTRTALGDVARWVRRRWGAFEAGGDGDIEEHTARVVVGVTGSAGKTSTKALITAALSAAGRVHASRGSLNNETGVPLTLLGLRPFHDFAVVEMGMRGLGQIAYLRDLAEPDVAVVVNAGVAHVGVVGSTDDIARGKSEIYERLPEGGVAVYPAGDPRLAERARQAPRSISFGEEDRADVRLSRFEPAGTRGSDIELQIGGSTLPVRLPLIGKHNALNAACAVAAAIAAGVPATVAVSGLARARPAPMRSELVDVAGRHVLLDCYNANPASMTAALEALAQLRGRSAAFAVLGDMLELGDGAPEAHRDAGRQAAGRGIRVVALGDLAALLAEGAGGEVAADPDAAADWILEHSQRGDWVLVKASRGVRLERVVEAMRRKGDAG